MSSKLLLLLTAALWGFAFVAQRQGMEHLDPFTFNAIRFALGALFVRFVLFKSFAKKTPMLWLPGLVLFAAASLQQIGIIYTSAGSAGFITGLYVLFVPILGFFLGQKSGLRLIISVVLAVFGLYLLSSFASAEVTFGNLLVLISAVFWAMHVQIVHRYSRLVPTAVLAFDQFAVCALLSTAFALGVRIFMHPQASFSASYFIDIGKTLWPLLYGGIMSAGVAYTLQIKAQKKVEPGPAAVIMSLEGVFAMLGGYLLLKESLSLRSIVGASILLLAMLLVSIPKKYVDKKSPIDLTA
ncbi:MAG: DMT family transporter [Candidatus Cloacimonetes bacterium]|jgi:drug/metabolite transporter (DMT)-like permease|nr:DMT family transporter [Candidatus Cloacimonadota bacterium]MDY0173045.1 DMT family transporter [Candidatus Cloacimonadaceae bacterium]